jgi:hypothetical protein
MKDGKRENVAISTKQRLAVSCFSGLDVKEVLSFLFFLMVDTGRYAYVCESRTSTGSLARSNAPKCNPQQ